MNKWREQLSQHEIMNAKRIQYLKQTIEKQYPHDTPKQKAQKLASLIYLSIEQSLPDYPKETKKRIRNKLIQEKLVNNSLIITLNDVVHFSVQMLETEDIHTYLIDWLQKRFDDGQEKIEQFVQFEIEQLEKAEQQYEKQESQKQSNQVLKTKMHYVCFTFFTLVFIAGVIIYRTIVPTDTTEVTADQDKIEETGSVQEVNDLPNYLQYQNVNEDVLRQWLNERNSILADEPYFSTILTVAYQYDVHPFLLFAITGQEQGFVPRDHPNVLEIANNPFNVYHSWSEYNTTIEDSTQIAARTIVNLSKDRPEDIDPLQWINRKYAEDQNWWKGVSSLFEKLEKEAR